MTTRIAALAALLLAAACSPKEHPTPIEPEAPTIEVEATAEGPGLAEVAPEPADAEALRIPEDEDCFGLYYGYGGRKDWPAARACFAREVSEEAPCNGSSPSLARLFLTVMTIDGQAGPAKRDLSLLDGCFEDMAVQGVDDLLAKSPTGEVDFCSDIGGTTLSMNECAWVDVRRASADQAEVEAELVAKHGHGHQIVAAAKVMEDAVAAEGNWTSDLYRKGTLRTVVDLSHRVRRYDMRTTMLRELAGKTFDPGPRGDVAAAYQDALTRVRDAEHERLLVQSQRAWQRYASAELAWVRSAGLPADAVKNRLEGERATILLERDPQH